MVHYLQNLFVRHPVDIRHLFEIFLVVLHFLVRAAFFPDKEDASEPHSYAINDFILAGYSQLPVAQDKGKLIHSQVLDWVRE